MKSNRGVFREWERGRDNIRWLHVLSCGCITEAVIVEVLVTVISTEEKDKLQ